MSGTFEDTVDLIRAARAGDTHALNVVAARYREPLLERIRLMMGVEARRAAESDDFLQGVLCEVVRDFESLRQCDEQSFLRWATHLARNNIRDAVRRRRERAVGSFASSIDWQPARGDAQAAAPPAEAARLEDVDRLIDAMTKLPVDHRRVIELRDFDGLSFAEVGREMNRSENATQLLHFRALIGLGAALDRG